MKDIKVMPSSKTLKRLVDYVNAKDDDKTPLQRTRKVIDQLRG